MPSIAAAATVKILLGRGTRDWRMSFSLVVGGEVVDGVTALRVEAGDARDRVDAAREPAPGNEHDRVDGLGDQPAPEGDARSEERGVGHEGVRTCGARG